MFLQLLIHAIDGAHMKQLIIITYSIVAGLVLLPGTAYAYLDPTTGAMIFHAVLACLAAAIVWISITWQKGKAVVLGLFSSNAAKFQKQDDD